MSCDIVCFGDSLTAGFQAPTSAHPSGRPTPYAEFLQERLGNSIRIRTSGICGELTAEMTTRFRRDVLAHQPRYVVILGGTNDLGWNAQPPDIMRNLVKMYELARSEQVIPIPVAVPSILVETEGGGVEAGAWVKDHLTRRVLLNGLIRQYAESKQLPFIDLFEATAEPGTRLLARHYSNDGLHLTTAGYRRLADLLYDQIFSPAYHGSQERIS